MDELDRYLKELAETAKQHPPGSRMRILSITRLLNAVESSGKLYCRGRFDYPPEVYHDAMQEVRAYIFRLIDRYDPSGAKLITLINQKLNYQFKDAIKKFQKDSPQSVSLSQAAYASDTQSTKTLEDNVSQEVHVYLSDQIQQIIEDDSESVFRQKCIRGRPEANFQAIALHILSHHTMRELAKDWDVSEQTLYSFFRRCCQNFQPLIKKYLSEY